MAQEYAGRLRRQALGPRILTSAIGMPLLVGLLWLGGIWWLLLAAAILAVGVLEFASLRALSRRREPLLGAAAGLAFVSMATGPDVLAHWIVGAWALALIVLGLIPLLRPGVGPRMQALGPHVDSQARSIVLGTAYLAVPLAVLVRWRLELSAWSVLAFLIVIWVNDIAAYFVGLAFGRHKLAARVSPGKSWEGALGGLAGGLAAGLLLAPWVDLPSGAAAAWAAITTVVSQAGDLFESALKRHAGVKDSGRLLPGHGGVLDRFDGILIAGPAAYIALKLLVP